MECEGKCSVIGYLDREENKGHNKGPNYREEIFILAFISSFTSKFCEESGRKKMKFEISWKSWRKKYKISRWS